MKKKASGTHRPLGSKSGASAGLESGVAEVKSFTAGQGVTTCAKTQRPKAEKAESIAKG